MIDSKTLFEIRDKRNNVNGKFEVYRDIARMTIDNAIICINDGDLEAAETWMKLGEYCTRKISECKAQLEDLEATLNKMKERDLA